MKRVAALAVFLVLLYGCTSPFGLTFREDCEDKSDSQLASCYHLAAVSEGMLYQESGRAADTCRLISGVQASHPDDDIGRRAETEKNMCFYDVVRTTARFDASARHLCDEINQAEFSGEFFGAAVTRTMCEDAYEKQRDLAAATIDNENSLCNMVLAITGLLLASVFYREMR